jgi:hypothetical protein
MLAFGQEQVPQPGFPGARLQFLDDGIDLPRTELFRFPVEALLVPIDVGVHERLHAML